MTSRNLNRTWKDVVFAQYVADHAADVPFPLRYLINATPWRKDIFIEIHEKISPQAFRRAVADFYLAQRFGEPVYRDERIAVRPRVPWKDGRREEEDLEGTEDVDVDDGNNHEQGDE